MYDLGGKLKTLRLQRGLTQEALGRRINKSKSAICGYETNAQIPPLDVLESIASILGVSLDYLVGFDSTDSISLNGLNDQQKEIFYLLHQEFLAPNKNSSTLSESQIIIIQKLISEFTDKMSSN